MNRLETRLGGVVLPNPVIPASGTFGFGWEMAQFYDLDLLGAIALKGTTREARYGNPLPRIAECPDGLLNAIGLQNPGMAAAAGGELPRLRKVYKGVIIANISGFSMEEYTDVARAFDQGGADILEINISCPNVRCGGMAFGVSAENAAAVCRAVKAACKKPVFMKLSPNVTDIGEIAAACEGAGADGLTLINTLLGMAISPRTGRPVVSTGAAGLSGPAIKPVALRMVYEAGRRVRIPIMGAGGVACADDALEMLSAGASAVQVGSQNLRDPWACRKIVEDLPRRMDLYGIETIKDIIGRARG